MNTPGKMIIPMSVRSAVTLIATDRNVHTVVRFQVCYTLQEQLVKLDNRPL